MNSRLNISLLLIATLACIQVIHSFNIKPTIKIQSNEKFDADKGQNWVILVAGSNGYFNYRHQADICHAYQIVTQRGIPKSNIITFMYDDIAFNKDNPKQGSIFNEFNGTNVYPGVQAIDYRGEDVRPEVFLSVLRGETNITRGNGKTLKSGPNDRIFIYFSDHGATNLLAFPGFNVLHASDLIETLQFMYKKRMYNQLLFYVEACESGSMFNTVLNANLNIYAETASSPYESSYACDYSNDVNAYLNDCYSINWMNDTDFCDVRKETVGIQFDNVLAETSTSHVCKYGDMSLEDETLIYFQGNISAKQPTPKPKTFHSESRKPIDSRLVYEDYLLRNLEKHRQDPYTEIYSRYLYRYQDYIKGKSRVDKIFSSIGSQFKLATLQSTRRLYLSAMERKDPSKSCYHMESVDLKCVKNHIQIYEGLCGKFDEYSIRYASHLRDTCLMNVKSEDLYRALSKLC